MAARQVDNQKCCWSVQVSFIQTLYLFTHVQAIEITFTKNHVGKSVIFKKSHLTTKKNKSLQKLTWETFRDWIPLYMKKTFLSQKMYQKTRPAFLITHHHHHQPLIITQHHHALTTRVSVTSGSTKWWWWCLLSAFFVFFTFLTSQWKASWPNSLRNDQFAELFFCVRVVLFINSWILLLLNFRPFLFCPVCFLSCEVGRIFFWWEMRMNHSYSLAKKNDCPLTLLEEIEEKLPIPENDCHIWSMLIHFKKETWFCESISSIFGVGV